MAFQLHSGISIGEPPADSRLSVVPSVLQTGVELPTNTDEAENEGLFRIALGKPWMTR